MKYKYFLSGFALVFLTTSNILLSQDRSTLLEQLSLLGQKITVKAQEMRAIEQESIQVLLLYFKTVSSEKNLDEKQLLEMGLRTDNENAQFKKELFQAFTDKHMIGFFSQKLFTNDIPYQGLAIDIVKFNIVRLLVEYRILRDLVEKYERLAQQLAKIDITSFNE